MVYSPIYSKQPSSLLRSYWGKMTQGSSSSILSSIPPTGLVLLSCFAIQFSSIGAKSLFETLGVMGAGFLCKGIAAVFLLLRYPPNLKLHSIRAYLPVFLLGCSIAVMTLCIYGAIARIPLGIASTLEFLGPLGVSILGSRRPLDFVWIVLAAAGVVLLSPFQHASLDVLGVGLALLAGLGWGAYILCSNRVGQVLPSRSGLALAMAIATLLMMPFGLAEAGATLLHWKMLAIGLFVAGLGVVIPYSWEYTAIQKLSPRVFGVLMSIEPAIAALVGFVMLGEVLTWQSAIAIVLVTGAAVGSTASRTKG
jgi:inner membrane transporter RhtA